MIIKYFIPEDGDDQNHPNVFELKNVNKQSISLQDIKQGFPISGIYHFRFLSNISSHVAWLDIIDDQANVPFHNGGIFIKASRIESQSVRPSPISRQHVVPTHQNNSVNVESSLLFNDDQPPAKPPKYMKETLLSFADDDNIPIPPSVKKQDTSLLHDEDDNDLLGMSSTTTSMNSSAKQNTMGSDFFGLDAPLQPTKVAVNQSPMLNPMMKSSTSNPNFIQTNNTSGNNSGMGSMNPMGGGNRAPVMGTSSGIGMNQSISSKYGSSSSNNGITGGSNGPIGSMKTGPMTTNAQYDPFNSIDIMSSGKPNNNSSNATQGKR